MAAFDVSEQRRRLLAQLLADEGLGPAAPAVPERGSGEPAPLSYAQELLWLLDRASPGLTAYNSPVARRVHGPLDAVAFGRAVEALVERHEALRTTIQEGPSGPMQIPQAAGHVPIAHRDLRGLPPADRDAAARAFLRELANRPFDLGGEPPLRVALARVADDEHLLLLLTHHIASDAWSYGVIFRELTALYEAAERGVDAGLPPVSWQSGDYAAWQRGHLRGDELERRLAYWRERLTALPVLALPTGRGTAGASAFAGARCSSVVPRRLYESMRRLARERGTTPYVVLLAAYQSVLHRYTGQDEVVVGSAVAGRTRTETESMVGYLSQALPMRTSFAGDPTFAELLSRVSEVTLGAFEHQDVPLEPLLLELQRAGRPSEAPLFRAVLTMQDALPATLRFGRAWTEPLALDSDATKFDLTLLATERDEGLELGLWFRTDLFEAASAERFLMHLERLLESAVRDPSQRTSRLPLLSERERTALACENDEPRAVDLQPVPASIAAIAARQAGSPAVAGGGVRLTYAELDRAANRLAHRLLALGAAPGEPVGVCLERSVPAIVALLAVWKAGASYVPLPPDAPPLRLAAHLSQSGARVAVTTRSARDRLPPDLRAIVLDGEAASDSLDREPAYAPPVRVGLDDTAYVIFTSGSTGAPKGVVVTHRNLAHYVASVGERLGLGPDDRWQFGTVSSLGADLGNTAIFPALCSGGTLHVVPPEIATDPARFAAALAREPLDVLKITPSHFAALLEAQNPSSLPRRWLVLGGEAAPWHLVDRVRRLGACAIMNHYGPTETTVGACTYTVGDASPSSTGSATVPIGRPLAGVRAYVLDSRQQLVPAGIPGELFVGGAGVAAGYVSAPEPTAQRFMPDPFSTPGARMYRTGDRVRRLESGELEYLGRLDDQVKIRGFRVELGEIESELVQHPGVEAAAALVRPDAGGESQLLAYVVPRGGAGVTPAALQEWLAERLPSYMLPASLTLLERFPLTPNGKLDRAALRQPDASAAGAPGYVAPESPTEVAVAEIWAAVLKRERVGREDGFFDLGGHSILAIRVLGKIGRRFGVRLSLRALFDAPTVGRLARAVDEARSLREEPPPSPGS